MTASKYEEDLPITVFISASRDSVQTDYSVVEVKLDDGFWDHNRTNLYRLRLNTFCMAVTDDSNAGLDRDAFFMFCNVRTPRVVASRAITQEVG
jgi:hypothetical protein